MSNLVNQSEFASKCGISRQRVHALVVSGKIHLTPSKKIDLDSQEVAEYIKRHNEEAVKNPKALQGGKKGKTQSTKKKIKKQHEKTNMPQVDDDIREKLEPDNIIDLENVMEEYGLDMAKKIVDIRNKETDTRNKHMKLQIQRGKLFERETVGNMLFGYLESMNKRILDAPENYIDTVIAIVEREGKEGRQKIIDMINNQSSLAIKACKTGIISTIKNALQYESPVDFDEE